LIGANALARRALIWGLIAGVLTGVVTQFLPRLYLARATILPAAPPTGVLGGLGALQSSGLLGMMGSALGGGENAVLTYPEILLSTPILERILSAPKPPNAAVQGPTVLEAIHVTGRTERERRYKGVTFLARELKVAANSRSGLITVRIATRDSVLSAFIVNTALHELDVFNVTSRASKGRAVREFVAKRVEDARIELSNAENALARFRESNLRIGNSPALLLAQTKLEREVQIQAEVFRLLSTQYEMARIEEYRDTSTFSVVEPATPPYKKYWPSTILNIVSGAGAAVAFALFTGLLERRARNPDGIMAGEGIRA
jgi:uncharacterized protein involved in exopolysaccharide biosynthesis